MKQSPYTPVSPLLQLLMLWTKPVHPPCAPFRPALSCCTDYLVFGIWRSASIWVLQFAWKFSFALQSQVSVLLLQDCGGLSRFESLTASSQ